MEKIRRCIKKILSTIFITVIVYYSWKLFPYIWGLYLVYLVFVKSKNPYKVIKSFGVSIDRFANYEFRTLWNTLFRIKGGYNFGLFDDTLSYALAINKEMGTLTKLGQLVCKLLDILDSGHIDRELEK